MIQHPKKEEREISHPGKRKEEDVKATPVTPWIADSSFASHGCTFDAHLNTCPLTLSLHMWMIISL